MSHKELRHIAVRPARRRRRPRWYKVVPGSGLHEAIDTFRAGMPVWAEVMRTYGEALGIAPILAYRCDLDGPMLAYHELRALGPRANHFCEREGAWTPKRNAAGGRTLRTCFAAVLHLYSPPSPPANLMRDRGFTYPAFVARRDGCYYIVRPTRHRRPRRAGTA
ncbi:hypothetical protein EXIGUO8H_360008 [Exiguobacterium sp. 8H]|nr:hypothetical protein EXIGUO8H_360008 [Exiguobacterium sp. 8H]